MARSPLAVQQELLLLSPPGDAFPTSPDSYWGAELLAQATELSLAEVSMEAMLPQIDMRQAFQLLPDYERVLGPDPCGQDYSSLGFGQQAAIAYSRWTAGGNVCAGYFIRLAAALGVTITIQEAPNWVCGGSTCSDQMVPYCENFAISVTLPATSLTNFECGVATCDDSLGLFTPSLVQCPLTCGSPEHITFYFNYEGS